MRLLASSGAASVWLSILEERNEWEFATPTEFINDPRGAREAQPFPTVGRNLSRLFSHQAEPAQRREFRITADGVYEDLAFELNSYVSMAENEISPARKEPPSEDPALSPPQSLTVWVGGERSYGLMLFDLKRVHFPPAGGRVPHPPARHNAVFLPALGWRSNLTQLRWEKVALRGAEVELIRALQIVLPGLNAVSMLPGSPYGTSRILVRLDGSPDRTPLASLGSSAVRLFELGLALVSTEANVILLDEVENGMHYSTHEQFWKLVFELAAQRDLQVFAITHSFDCIRGFQAAASAHPEEGALVRLRVIDGVHYATTFNEHDLEVVSEDSIEVR